MCAAEKLVDGVSPLITTSGSNLVLGTAPTAAVPSADVYQSAGMRFARNLTALTAARQQLYGDVRVSIQGRQYLSRTQSVAKRDPISLAAVLRTPSAWVDRVKVRVAYQVKDMYGSAVVNRPSRVTMRMEAPATGLSAETVTC